MLKIVSVLLLSMLVPLLRAADETPAADAAKYPQDTPQKALDSIIKALEAKDYAYYISFMVLPVDKERMLKKHGSVQKYAESKADASQAAGMKNMVDVLKSLQKDGKTSEGTHEDKTAWTRFESGKEKLQLEKQADGRWVMNLRPPTDAPKDAGKK
ncbi:MAG TPA: hypothetical protein VEJ63_23465 [Planctomycetota bacterium]|nr:hypothetical protein [Planctomycetota bacterium]